MSYVGNQMQMPPMYSALKVDGKRLYKLARKGKEIELQPRPVSIYSIEIKSISLPTVQFLLRCSKGTYIRTLAHDIGQQLGVGAHLSALRRTKVGHLSVEDAYDLPAFVEYIKKISPNF
jgi:tRNA pseudouridine55 synthase